MASYRRLLPSKGSPELEKIKEIYPTAPIEWVRETAEKLGFASHYTFMDSMRKMEGVCRTTPRRDIGDIKEPEQEQPIIVNLPPLKLREYKAKKARRGDEETAVAHCGDGHACKITKSYNEDVYKQRMDTLFDSIMTIVTLHRNMYPINVLRIVNTGDNTQGENPYQGSTIGSVSMGARDQTTKVAYPAWAKLIGSLKQEFAEVEFDGFPGNHGYTKGAPETSREDLRLYDLLQAYFFNTKGITINIHDTFGDIIYINDFRFFCFHGDEIPCQQGVPFFALDKKLKSWYMQFGGFNYALGGHFHKYHADEVSSKFEYLMTSTLVSDDEWAIKKLGISSSPSQNIFGVHPTMGMTWRYKMVVDKAFLMTKLPDVYGEK